MALKQTTNRGRAAQSARALRRCGLPLFVSVLLAAVCLSAVRLVPGAFAQEGAQGRGSRPAGVTPKRQSPRTKAQAEGASSSKAAAQSNGAELPKKPSARAVANSALEALSPLLAAADFDLVGLAVTANPPSQTVPKNTPTSVLVSVKVPEGTDPAPIIAGLNPEYRVRGELTGPSLSAPRTIEAPVGQPLPIPPLAQAGEHLLQNLRVVDTGRPDEPVVAAVTPDACGITVIERLLVSEVHVNELTYEQIVQAGINISDDSYRAFNFTVGLGTISEGHSITIPVAFPSVGVNASLPVVGTPTVNAPGIDAPTVIPVLLTPSVSAPTDGSPAPEEPKIGDEPVRIPGVVVFPGRVGFLHQFFEAIVIVSNGAPNGAPLVLRNLHAKSRLPDAGTPGDESDDPLRIAETQTGGRVSELDLHGLGADQKYGTADDTVSFRPGEAGQATFLLEGLKDGLHTVDFDLSATLEGLPSGPVQVQGTVPGAVLVRDASFAVTFTHPGIVRAGQEYDLAMTVTNTGSRDILGAFARLNRNGISGAELIGQDAGERQFPTTIVKKDSATIKWRLRASVTGEVTASYVKVGDDVSAGLQLVTGVGDRNIPLSPESLILPDPVRHLPPDFVEAARGVLGQGWSIANAPPGSLPAGVLPVTKQSVIDRAVELGLAGMRVDFGETSGVSIETLMRDWLGELKQDAGFADALRETPSGNAYYDAAGTEIYKRLTAAGGISAADYQRELADTESSRSPFISALVTHADGQPAAGVRLVNASNERVGFGASASEREVDLDNAGALVIGKTDAITRAQTTLGQLALASNVAAENWKVELTGWREGAADLSLLYAASGRTYRQVVWSGVPLTAGSKYRVSFRTLSSSTATPVLEIFDGTNYVPSNVEGVLVTLDQPAPRLVGAIQVTPDVVAGGDKYGRLVGLLFSKPMLRDQAESISRYAVGGGQLKNTDQAVGGPVKVKGAHLDYGDRFAFLSLDSPVGPYIKRDITVTSMSDARRMPLASAPVTMPIDARVSPEGIPPGAYLTGRVLNADGTPVAGANVIYWTQECPDPSKVTLPPPPMPIAVKTTDAQGRYEIDYVRDGDCAPLSVTVNNPVTHSEKRLTSPVAYDGQHMVFDMVFLARGNVAGRVTVAGQPVAKAFVNIVPALDVVGTQVVETDENGRYTAAGVPVGNVSVFAVGTGDLSNSSGFGAGNIDGPNQTATVNISMQNTGGRVTGRVVRSDGGPAVGALVVAYAVIPGVPSQRGDGATAVGYAYADRDGQFTISKIPVGDVVLETTDYVNGMKATQRVTLTNAAPQASNILITLPGLGAVSGRVLNETGEGVSKAIVTSAGRGVETDAQGFYTMTDMPAGTHGLSAIDPATLQTGAASALVRIGQTTENVNIVILRPSTVEGTVTVLEEGQSVPKPVAGAYVSSDGTDLVQTDGLGHYKLPNVTPNEQLTLRVFDTKTMFVSNLEIRLAPGETLTRDVTFRPGTIRGRVTQPDGVTGTVADLQVYSPRPYLKAGLNLGLLDASNPATTRSAADGSYTVTGNNPGAFRVSTSNAFFPTPVSAGGLLAPSGVAVCDLSLVSTLAGKIQGRVFQPDGTTPVGPGVNVTLGGGSLADATVRTDANGHYEFGEVFSAGAYRLTATDPVSGASNRINVAVQRNKDAVFDLRLLGTGSLRVKVVDGGGQPVQSGSVTLDGSAYPNTHRFAEITPDSGGVIAFDNLPEGAYAVAATERGLGGRVAVNVTPGGTVETTIQLQASGTVEGRVLMPGGTVPVGLADVELRSGGRSIGFAVTTDVEGDADASGHFQFLNVPAGDFTIEVFDNRTGRAGRSAGRINTQDETATVNVQVFAIGAVAGRVTSNGQPVDHALVEIYADGAGLRSAHLKATTDEDGRYRFTGIPAGRFTVNVSGAPGGQGGSVSGVISGTNEPLPDTIADIALEPTQTVTGTVYKLGGTEPLPGALVTIYVGPRVYRTNANDAGVYRLSFVTLGSVIVRAEAPAGYDRGEAPAVAGTTPGATITSNVTLAGVGRVAGTARDNNGAPLNVGTVTFSNNDWTSTRIELTTSVRADGTYKFDDVPVGNFTLKLTAPNRVGTAAAAGAVAGGQTANVDLRLEDAGRVVGRVVSEGAGVPVAGADVTLTLYRQTGGTLFFYAHSDSQGAFAFESIPLGTASVAVSDTTTGGVARASNLALAANAQVIDFGDIRLDATPVRVESVTPADGTGNVSPSNAAVTVNFSEPAQGVNSGSVRLLKGSAAVGAGVTLSPDGRVATLTPSGRLADTSTYTVVVSTSVQDLNGLALASEFRSSFTTRDETGPVVTGVTPADGAAHLPLATDVVVTFDEPLDPAQDFSAVLRVTTGSPAAPVAGTVTRAADGKSATFHATAGLVEGVRHTVTVASQRDALGNVQTASFSSSFTTLDTTPPVVDPLPIDGTTVRTFRPAVTATYHDNASGVSTSSVVLTLDGANVTAGATVTGTGLSYTPAATLARGAHTVTLRVSDNQENVSDVRTATFHIDDSGPVITGFTVAGAPAVEGMFVTSSLQPVVAVTYSDDTGIDPSATQVLFGPRGSTLQPVAATVTQTGLTYQPAAPLAEGEYTVEATIVNNLGTSTATPRVNFTLDVDAPEIISLTPSSGSQHGGTTVTMTGNRLLNTTGTAPAVNVGGSPALIKSAEPGTPDTVVFTTPAGAPGPTAVEVRTDRGRALLTGGFNYEADPRTPFSVEPDTTVLWHLDETGNGAVTVKDSAGILAGTASTASLEQPGRFMGGRSRASLVSITDIDNVLNFGASSFTAECWVKTGPVNRTYTLVGKTHSSEASANYIYGNFALQLLPSGALRALLFDTANIRWQADMPATAVNTIDNQWHAVAMVVNREQGRLSLYVDGVERASAAMPSGFGSMISGYPLRAGTIDDSGPQTTGTTRIAEFTGTLDEVRVSASAHSPEQMLATYRGTEGTLGLVVLKYGPQSLPRGTTVQMPLTGYNLSGVTASVVDAAGVPQVTRTVTSSATNAVVEIDVSPTAALGATQVVFSSPAGSVSKPVSIVELGQSVYDVEPDTRVLWHLDESGDGAVRIGDSATLSIDGTASSASQMQEGRFGRGRSRASLVADTDFGALNFGASSFTAECWVKTGPVNRTYTLVGKNHSTEASANYIYG
ncbi:MAG: carboxypeptidase regulatory-like domain-containing protein, partial [Acidobacteria bacterium]|nr:carboxypeptidase regulatory-like domain-containing protein [Acidobacteriota bacterium]